MDKQEILFGTLSNTEEGFDIGDSLSEQLGCFSTALTGIAAAVTAVITMVISVISVTHWVLNFL